MRHRGQSITAELQMKVIVYARLEGDKHNIYGVLNINGEWLSDNYKKYQCIFCSINEDTRTSLIRLKHKVLSIYWKKIIPIQH